MIKTAQSGLALMPIERKASSETSSLLTLAVCNIWQQRKDCKGCFFVRSKSLQDSQNLEP